MPKLPHDLLVSIGQLTNPVYPKPPFHPPKQYPELASLGIHATIDPSNELYNRIRDIFRSFDLDQVHDQTPDWNPLKSLVAPGDRVFIKPNLVFHHHKLGDDGVLSMITHGSVLRPIIDYVWLALQGKGDIMIGDVPLQTADWSTLIKKTGLKELVEYYQQHQVPVSLLDLRLERAKANRYEIIIQRHLHHGDPRGYIAVNLGKRSQLTPVIKNFQKLTITDYPAHAVAEHHNPDRNEYLIAKSVLAADVFINVPKLKTHKKGGVTLSMKNLIGINGDKSWIAHHREGTVAQGGDEFSSINRFDLLKYRLFIKLKRSAIGVLVVSWLLSWLRLIGSFEHFFWPSRSNILQLSSITEGSWFGNDTLWRVIIDLNRILLYADKNGQLHTTSQRKYLTMIDGVWAGQGNGPMHHSPKKVGVIIGGFNPVLTDAVATHLMGFDWQKIPQIYQAFQAMEYPLVDQSMKSAFGRLSVIDLPQPITKPFTQWSKTPTFAFVPPSGWAGHIEHAHRQPADETDQALPGFDSSGGE